MMSRDRIWDGKAVGAVELPNDYRHNRPVKLHLSEGAARTLALTLARTKQTTIPLPGEVQEILDAINYVTLGDPRSTEAHAQMEAGKGMTPDGGYRTPAPINDLPANLPILGGPGVNHSGTATGSIGSC